MLIPDVGVVSGRGHRASREEVRVDRRINKPLMFVRLNNDEIYLCQQNLICSGQLVTRF